MKIVIDTEKDSKEDIRKVLSIFLDDPKPLQLIKSQVQNELKVQPKKEAIKAGEDSLEVIPY